MVSHGISVVLNAEGIFRFIAQASPKRHLAVEAKLGADFKSVSDADAGRVLADRITWFMERLGLPNGLSAAGYTNADIPPLVERTLR